jgi:hypothetical protein
LQEFGVAHPKVAHTLMKMAELYAPEPVRAKEVEALLQRALAMREKAFGPAHRIVAETLHALGVHYQRIGRSSQAKELLTRAVNVWDNAFGVKIHTHLGSALFHLSELHT